MPESVFFSKDEAFVRHGNWIKYYLLQKAILLYSYAPETVFSFKVSDLGLWPCDPKINRGVLPNMDNHPMKFEHCGPNET
jgi:hypothetical protein